VPVLPSAPRSTISTARQGLEKLALSLTKLIAVAKKINTNPTEAQQEAGNYQKGRVSWKGLVISIETPKGAYRRGVGKDGKPWSRKLRDYYGYFLNSEAKDGDHVDVFICDDHLDSELVFVVNQIDPDTDRYDEPKVIIGTTSEEAARKVYLRNYEDGWQGLGSIVPMTLPAFKRWLRSADTKKRVKEALDLNQGEPSLVIDRPKGFKKTFNTSKGPLEMTYPMDYGYFSGVVNPQDNEDADVFVGSGGPHHGRFMKGKRDKDNKMIEDEHKWYSGLTPEELTSLQTWWNSQHDPGLTWDWQTLANRKAVLASMGWKPPAEAKLPDLLRHNTRVDPLLLGANVMHSKTADLCDVGQTAKQTGCTPQGETKKLHGFSFVKENAKGTYKSFHTEDDPVWKDYPLKGVTYPVDYGYIAGHQSEDGEDLDVFSGTGDLSGYIKVWRYDVPIETKIVVNVTSDEWRQILKTFGPVLTAQSLFKDVSAMQSFVSGYKRPAVKTAAVKFCGVFVKYAAWDSKDRPFYIAVDLDGTLAEKMEPFDAKKIGEPRENAKYWLDKFREAGAKIIIFTVRGDDKLVKAWLDKHDLPWDYINENPDQPPDSSGKVYADCYLDDRGINAEDLDAGAEEVLRRIDEKDDKKDDDEPLHAVMRITHTRILLVPEDVLAAIGGQESEQ
jgi:inorganic pyrophosphatase